MTLRGGKELQQKNNVPDSKLKKSSAAISSKESWLYVDSKICA